MKVRILEDFTGYPDGTDKSRTLYKADETPDLPDEFAELIIRKRHAEAADASRLPLASDDNPH